MENREHPRICFGHPLTFSRFNSNNYRLAKSLNCSEGGICFESPIGVKTGTAIYLRMENSTPVSKIPGAFRTVGIATVRWCDEFSDSYRIGAKYFIEYY